MNRRLSSLVLTFALTIGVPLSHAAQAQAQPTTATNDVIVQNWYRDFLGRTFDDSRTDTGRLGWVNRLNAGESRESVLGGILRTREYANREVSSYYSSFLNRAPDPGAAYWINNTSSNDMAYEWVAQNILASDELRYRYSYPSYYVDSLYSDILGRYSPGTGEENYWNGRLNQVGALQVVREIWYSDEAVRYRLDNNYESILTRPVDYNGVQYWYPYEVQSDITVQVRLGSTAEYASTAY